MNDYKKKNRQQAKNRENYFNLIKSIHKEKIRNKNKIIKRKKKILQLTLYLILKD